MHIQLVRPRPSLLAGAIASASLALAAIPGSAFAVTPVTHYVISPSPIAAAGSLPAGHLVNVTVSAESSTNTLVPGAVIYLAFSPAAGGGTAKVGTTALTSGYKPFTAATGAVTVAYMTPATLPTGGKDIVKAANTNLNPTITASAFYSYSLVTRYAMSPTPFAAAGSLAAGASVSATLTAYNAANTAVPNVNVYLSFVPTTGGGSAWVGTTALTGTPMPFKTSLTGQIAITYKAAAVLPTTGTDVLTFVDSTKNATISRNDAYSYGKLASYLFAPSPIAALGTLGANKSVTVTLWAKDALGGTVAGAYVYLKFMGATGGGSAMVGSKALSATAARFATSTTGSVTITYKTGATVPVSGTDTISAGNVSVSPTITASDIYTF